MNKSTNPNVARDPAKIQKFLANTHFPASKHELLDAAKKNQAPPEFLESLDSINQGNFSGIEDVLRSYGLRDRSVRDADTQADS